MAQKKYTKYLNVEYLFENPLDLDSKGNARRTKVLKILNKLRINTISELTRYRRQSFEGYKYMGTVTLDYIEERLNKYGFKFYEPQETIDSTNPSLDKEIRSLNLSSRAGLCLERIGLNDESKIRDLAGKTEEELQSIRGIGKTTLKEIRRTLEKLDIYMSSK